MSSCPRRATLTTFVLSCCSLLFACGGGSPATVPSPELPPELDARIRAIYETNEMQAESPLSQLWLPDGSGLLVLEPTSDEAQELVRYDATSGAREVIRSSSQLVPSGTSGPLVIDDFGLSPNGRRLLLQTNTRELPDGGPVSDCWLLDLESTELRMVLSGVASCRVGDALSPDGQRVLYIHGHNLYVHDVSSGRNIRLTHDGMPGSLGNGVSDWGGRGGEVRWSPDGEQIAYIQVDSREVGMFPRINYTESLYPVAEYLRFPKVGTPIPKLRLGVVSADGGPTRWMALPGQPGDFYLRGLDWAGSSEELVVEQLSRARDRRNVLFANVRTGRVSSAYQEADSAWVDSSDGTNGGIDWLGDGQAFVLVSEKDGWRHAYLISRDGRKETLLTRGAHDIVTRRPRGDPRRSFAVIDEERGWLYYHASPDDGAQKYLYRVRLDATGDAERVTPEDQPGTHSYDFSPDARFAIHTYSTFDTPPVFELIELPAHRTVRVLEDNAALREKLKAWIARPTEFFTLDIGNGVVMDALMIKPRDFDAGKKYPVVIFVYGEPAGQTVLDDWGRGQQGHSLYHRALVDQGYLVVSMDNRGTPAPKGAAWRRAVFGSLGPLSTEEQADGLRELGRTRSYVDLSRVGIWGWSGGGTNTLNALFRKPDQYHVGIAVVPKPQADLYSARYQEIFMRTPEENPEGYRVAAPLYYAEGLKGRLLIVHGSGETNTHIQIVEHLVNRLIELGKPFEYMLYPNRNHGMREGEETRPHLYRLMSRYWLEHLPPGGQ